MSGEKLQRLSAVHCLNCLRIWILDRDSARDNVRDTCSCGCEFYPVSRNIVPGEELKLGDGFLARVQ